MEESQIYAEKAKHLQKYKTKLLDSIKKQLEGSYDFLHDAESEIASLKEKKKAYWTCRIRGRWISESPKYQKEKHIKTIKKFVTYYIYLKASVVLLDHT